MIRLPFYGTLAFGLAALLLSTWPTSGAQAASSLHIFPQTFKGMGDIALLYGNDGIDGGNLYTLTNSLPGAPSPSARFVQGHALSATFSGDGKWLMVMTVANNQLEWSLVAADGSKKEKLGASVYAGAFTPTGHTYYYSTDNGAFYRVTPPDSPQLVPLKLQKNSRISGISFYSGSLAAVTVTANDNQFAQARAYDEIALWHTGSRHPLLLFRAKAPNGLVMGPWLNAHEFFYWTDPDHSASIMADGLPLYLYNLSGRSRQVARTYAESSSVLPVSATSALLWENGYRYYYLGVQNGLMDWPNGFIPIPAHQLALFPALSPNRATIAFVDGPKWPSDQFNAPGAIRNWFSQLRLATVSLPGGRVHILESAGSDVSTPAFDPTGKRIVYSQGNQAAWVFANGTGVRHVFASAPPSPALNSLQIASYLQLPR